MAPCLGPCSFDAVRILKQFTLYPAHQVEILPVRGEQPFSLGRVLASVSQNDEGGDLGIMPSFRFDNGGVHPHHLLNPVRVHCPRPTVRALINSLGHTVATFEPLTDDRVCGQINPSQSPLGKAESLSYLQAASGVALTVRLRSAPLSFPEPVRQRGSLRS